VTFPPLAELIPHRGRSILLDEIASCAPGEIVCLSRIRDDFPYLKGGRAPAASALELAAQAAAAYTGLESRQDGARNRTGYIIAVREMRLAVNEFAVGTTLTIVCRLIRASKRTALFECTISGAEHLLDTSLTVWFADSPPAVQ
jgi:predicted hotdog family 3-hydroxylacyl-ACP dehydratase